MLLFLVDKLVGALATLPVMLLFLICFDKKRFSKKWLWVVLFAIYMNAMMVMVVPFGAFLPIYLLDGNKRLGTHAII